MKKNPTLAATGRQAAARLRELKKKSLEDTNERLRLAVQMVWEGPGFDRQG